MLWLMNITPAILSEIVNFIKSSPIVMSSTDGDGRINSKLDEAFIISMLQKKFGSKVITKVKERMAGDILVFDGKVDHVVNIKTTFGRAYDNAYSAGGYLIAFTDIPYESIPSAMSFKNMAKLISINKKETSRDYWFLVITKDSKNQQVMLRGLKQLNNAISNPSNVMQIHWGKELKTTPHIQTFEQSYSKMTGLVCESQRRKVKTINEGLLHFGLTV